MIFDGNQTCDHSNIKRSRHLIILSCRILLKVRDVLQVKWTHPKTLRKREDTNDEEAMDNHHGVMTTHDDRFFWICDVY
jgi:hypothetical protein